MLRAAREMGRRYRERPHKAGPGRGHKSHERPEIIDALRLGLTTEEVARQVGVSCALISAVRRELRSDGGCIGSAQICCAGMI